MTDEEMQGLKVKHGNKLLKVTIPATEFEEETVVVIRRSPRGEYKRFRAMLFDDSLKAEALETLAKACVVYPDEAGLRALIDERPGLAEVIGGRAAEFAGIEGKAESKKL